MREESKKRTEKGRNKTGREREEGKGSGKRIQSGGWEIE